MAEVAIEKELFERILAFAAVHQDGQDISDDVSAAQAVLAKAEPAFSAEEAKKMWDAIHRWAGIASNCGGSMSQDEMRQMAQWQHQLGIPSIRESDPRFTWDYRDYV